MSLNTAEDWWAEVDRRWLRGPLDTSSQLEDLIFGDVGCPIDATCAELISSEALYGRGSKMIARGLEGVTCVTFKDALNELITQRKPQLWYLFQSIWQDAPDHPKIHSWTMWGMFCDLCSEGPSLLWPEEYDG